MTVAQEKRADRDPLVIARAANELAGRWRLAATVAAAESGRRQRDIAAALNVSQPAVAQLLSRARRWPDEWQRTPRQVALECVAGGLSREQPLKELVDWPWTSGHFDDADEPWPEAYVRGTWDQLLDVVREGLLTDADYEYVFNHTT